MRWSHLWRNNISETDIDFCASRHRFHLASLFSPCFFFSTLLSPAWPFLLLSIFLSLHLGVYLSISSFLCPPNVSVCPLSALVSEVEISKYDRVEWIASKDPRDKQIFFFFFAFFIGKANHCEAQTSKRRFGSVEMNRLLFHVLTETFTFSPWTLSRHWRKRLGVHVTCPRVRVWPRVSAQCSFGVPAQCLCSPSFIHSFLDQQKMSHRCPPRP